MKRVFSILLALCLLLSLVACGQTNSEDESNEVTMHVVTEQKNYSNDQLSSTSTFTYDDHGRPTVVQWERTDGAIYRSEMTYDEHGNRTREAHSTCQPGSTELITTTHDYALTYTDNLLTHCDYYFNSQLAGGMDMHYDKDGNLILVQYDETYTENHRACWHSFEYDANGKLIRETNCSQMPMGPDSSGNMCYFYSLHRIDYSYDQSGNLSCYSSSMAQANDPVAHDQTDTLEFQAGENQYTFSTDKDGYLVWDDSEPDSNYTSGQFSILDEMKNDGYGFDENNNLVKSSGGTEFSYQSMELSKSDAKIAKRLIHGIARSMNAYIVFACMDPMSLYLCPVMLYIPSTYFPFYYLIPYPMW